MSINTKQLFDLQVPFFIPLWRRIAVVAVCFGWALFEFVASAPFWGFVFGAMGIFAAWQLLLSGWPNDGQSE
jgi:hypothetical protein